MIEIRSSWTVDERGVRPLGETARRLGDLSPRRQKIRERIARHGLTVLREPGRARRIP